jgi:hypothetical protein
MVLVLISEARSTGVKKILVTHADIDTTDLSVDDQLEMADIGALRAGRSAKRKIWTIEESCCSERARCSHLSSVGLRKASKANLRSHSTLQNRSGRIVSGRGKGSGW